MWSLYEKLFWERSASESVKLWEGLAVTEVCERKCVSVSGLERRLCVCDAQEFFFPCWEHYTMSTPKMALTSCPLHSQDPFFPLVPSNELERPHLSQTNHAEELYEERASLCVYMFMRFLHLNDAEQ